MNNIASPLQTVLQILPCGDWLAVSPYGIVYGTFLLNALTCLILLLSKVIFKEYFSSQRRKRVFLLFVGGTSLLTAACYMYVTIRVIPMLYYGLPDIHFGYLLPIYHVLILIAYLFFIGYLIDFILRLARRLAKGKTRKSAGE